VFWPDLLKDIFIMEQPALNLFGAGCFVLKAMELGTIQ